MKKLTVIDAYASDAMPADMPSGALVILGDDGKDLFQIQRTDDGITIMSNRGALTILPRVSNMIEVVQND